MSKDIVVRLRSEEWATAEREKTRNEAADLIEAMRGENAHLKASLTEWIKENAPGGWIDTFRNRAREAEAEVARLRQELDGVLKMIGEAP